MVARGEDEERLVRGRIGVRVRVGVRVGVGVRVRVRVSAARMRSAPASRTAARRRRAEHWSPAPKCARWAGRTFRTQVEESKQMVSP